MTDAVGTIGMFAEIKEPKEPAKRMARADVRLPLPVITQLEWHAEGLGVSVSELARWLIIEGLEKRDVL